MSVCGHYSHDTRGHSDSISPRPICGIGLKLVGEQKTSTPGHHAVAYHGQTCSAQLCKASCCKVLNFAREPRAEAQSTMEDPMVSTMAPNPRTQRPTTDTFPEPAGLGAEPRRRPYNSYSCGVRAPIFWAHPRRHSCRVNSPKVHRSDKATCPNDRASLRGAAWGGSPLRRLATDLD